jgi:hypothetical protein
MEFFFVRARKMGWAAHEVRMGEKRNARRILMGKPKGKRLLGRSRVGGWVILKWILEI